MSVGSCLNEIFGEFEVKTIEILLSTETETETGRKPVGLKEMHF